MFKVLKIGFALAMVSGLFLFGCGPTQQVVRQPEPVITAPVVAEPEGNMDESINELVQKISQTMTAQRKTKIAVVEFTDLQGNVTSFGKYLAEELITRLFETGKFRVIERSLLNKVIEEQKLTLTQLIDPSSAKELGRILGVDAIVSGTITDLVDKLKVNARIIGTETGDVFAVAATAIIKDETVMRLMGEVVEKEIAEVPISRNKKPKTVASSGIIFHEDFSNYEEGDPTDWGRNVYVKILRDGRKYLVSSLPGRHTVGQNVTFPENFYFQFDFAEWAERSTISLVDVKGTKYSIKWDSNGNHFTLPDGTSNKNRIEGDKTVRLNVRNNVIKIYVNGKFAVSGVVEGFDRFVRFEVDVSHTSGGWHIYLTNFIVGEL